MKTKPPKGWHLISTVADTQTYVSADGKVEMTIRPDGADYAVRGKPGVRYKTESEAREGA